MGHTAGQAADGFHLLRLLQLRFQGESRVLRGPQRGHVHQGAHRAVHAPPVIPRRRRPIDERGVLPVATAESVLLAPFRTGRRLEVHEVGQDSSAIVGVKVLLPPGGGARHRRIVSEDARQRITKPRDAGAAPPFVQHVARGLRDEAKAHVTLAQRLLLRQAIGRVANDGNGGPALPRFDATDRDVKRKLMPVGVHSGNEAGPVPPFTATVLQEIPNLTVMQVARRGRNQEVERLAEHRIRRVPEDAPRGTVGEGDAARRIDDEDPVHRGVEHLPDVCAGREAPRQHRPDPINRRLVAHARFDSYGRLTAEMACVRSSRTPRRRSPGP